MVVRVRVRVQLRVLTPSRQKVNGGVGEAGLCWHEGLEGLVILVYYLEWCCVVCVCVCVCCDAR